MTSPTESKCPECGVSIPDDAPGGLCPSCLLAGMLGPDAFGTSEKAASKPAGMEGEVLGERYRISQRIGIGGSGEVYLATQLGEVQRSVAIKVLRQGLENERHIARFETERTVLMRMDHPGIAQIYDAGVTQNGQPFLAMEFVDGVPITEFCRENQDDLQGKLNLFMKVAEGVAHAHQKGVIHRDLKPTNILVTRKGEPKIIDFGIARPEQRSEELKALFTQDHQVVGTPAYMSPEQAEGGGSTLDTRSDVYTLGVLFYELVSGQLPYDEGRFHSATQTEVLRIICEETPPKPSSVSNNSQLTGELDWICLKALEKEPGRRYDSVQSFASDIRRYLSNEPVSAGPPTTGYRVRKFVQRNRVWVTAGSLALVSMIAGVAFSVWFAIKASKSQRIAEAAGQDATTRAEKGEELMGFMLGELYDELEPTGRVSAMEGVAQQVANYYEALPESESASTKRNRALALANLARMHVANERREEAAHVFKEAMTLYDRVAPTRTDWTLEYAQVLTDFGEAQLQATERIEIDKEAFAEAEPAFQKAIALVDAGESNAKVLAILGEAYMNRGIAQMMHLRFEAAEEPLMTAIEHWRAAVREQPNDFRVQRGLMRSLNHLGSSLTRLERVDEGLRYSREAFELAEDYSSAFPEDIRRDMEVAYACQGVGSTLHLARHLSEAHAQMAIAESMWRRIWLQDPTNHQRRLSYAHVLRRKGRIAADLNQPMTSEAFQTAFWLEKPYVRSATEPLFRGSWGNSRMLVSSSTSLPEAGGLGLSEDRWFLLHPDSSTDGKLIHQPGTPEAYFAPLHEHDAESLEPSSSPNALVIGNPGQSESVVLTSPRKLRYLTIFSTALNSASASLKEVRGEKMKVIIKRVNGATGEALDLIPRDMAFGSEVPGLAYLGAGFSTTGRRTERASVAYETFRLREDSHPVESITFSFEEGSEDVAFAILSIMAD